MIIVRATADSAAGVMPGEPLLSDMGRFHEEPAKQAFVAQATRLPCQRMQASRLRYVRTRNCQEK
jgi:hypothetical protein